MKIAFAILGIAVLIFAGYMIFGGGEKGIPVTVYKSASCGCCVGYAGVLRNNGFDVNIKNVQVTSSIKSKYNISSNMQSCHTAIIGDYFVEGHVPIKAVKRLLKERPEIDGISLPRMPSGSPGMPGLKEKDFVIYSIKEGKASEFMRV